MQSLIPAVYPILKSTYRLDFSQIGLITLVGQIDSVALAAACGLVYRPAASLFRVACRDGVEDVAGLILTVEGAGIRGYPAVGGTDRIGVGDFPSGVGAHRWPGVRRPDTVWRNRYSRWAVPAVFSLGPLLAAFVVLPNGQRGIAWFSCGALAAMILLARVSRWHKAHNAQRRAHRAPDSAAAASGRRIGWTMTVLMALTFSKFFYLASITNYYTFFFNR